VSLPVAVAVAAVPVALLLPPLAWFCGMDRMHIVLKLL